MGSISAFSKAERAGKERRRGWRSGEVEEGRRGGGEDVRSGTGEEGRRGGDKTSSGGTDSKETRRGKPR